ncbi:DUF614 family protein [Acanthamoeba castellanii str. Neff]|uniref:DUF614 family protein n=1 Tax=Acanthamoeba castellanii (strain ATCC 30010 / Neff) TaxID=1257118 RepID=L8GUM2_ACACF|nr:DUF614 family protein [Acanthamoeba castellanii str. Neff]ELR16612.1 DUF614 family protein [Acanthamoeba castellanii str. Neff]
MSDWETGLCECFSDFPTCLSAYFCGCFDVAYHYAAAEDRECGVVDGLLAYCFFPCCACIARGKIREKYNISGSFLGDVLAVWCCGCCAVSQQSRELKHKGVSKYSCF